MYLESHKSIIYMGSHTGIIYLASHTCIIYLVLHSRIIYLFYFRNLSCGRSRVVNFSKGRGKLYSFLPNNMICPNNSNDNSTAVQPD